MALERRSRRLPARKKNDLDDQPAPASTTTIMESMRAVSMVRKGSRERKLQGLSLAVKFAIVISLVAASLCLVSQIVVYFRTKSALLWEIDRKGAALSKSVSALAQQYLEEYTKYIAEKPTISQPTSPDPLEKSHETIIQKYKDMLDQVRYYDAQKKAVNEIMNIAFHCHVGNIPGLQVGESTKELKGSPREFVVPGNNDSVKIKIQIIDGSIKTESGEIGVKSYSTPAVPDTMDVLVMLSAQDIVKTTDSLLFAIFITTIMAIFLGIGISIILAKQVTKPIRRLMRDIEIVAEGDLKHNTVATSEDEIGLLAHTFHVMTQNLRSAHETELENQAREHELKIATEIQSNLLPSQIPNIPNYEIAAYYHPAKEVGGDYYDFIEIDPNHLGVVIADVSGKGIPGSMLMTMTRALIRMEAQRNMSPAKIFTEVNRILAKDINRGMFVTAMYGILEISTHKFTISSAGHNPIVVARHATKQNEMVNPKGIALGLDKGTIFEQKSKDQTISLYPGDRVIFYTDGVPEAMSTSKEEFGDDRFLDIVNRTSGKGIQGLVDDLVQSLTHWKGSGPQSDDITIAAFCRIS